MSTDPREPGAPGAEAAGPTAPDLQDDTLAPVEALADLVPSVPAAGAGEVTSARAEAGRATEMVAEEVASEAARAPDEAAQGAAAVPAPGVDDDELVPLELPADLGEVSAAERTRIERAVPPPGLAPADAEAIPPAASVDAVLGPDSAAALEAAAEGNEPDDEPPAVDTEPLPDLAPILEALLFASDRPVTVQALSATLRAEHPAVRAPAVRAALKQLQQAYADDGRRCGHGFALVEVAGGYVFRSSPAFAPYLQRFTSLKPQRLSRAALETLAVVAYRQPVTRPQIDEVRGVESSSAVKYLLDKGLIRVLGKSEEVGRPLLYGTTPEFLELFGLRSLSHLPTLQEYQELDPDSQAKVDALPGPAPVRVTDLAAADGRVVSAATEEEGAGALEDLESAVAEADRRRRESAQTLAPVAGARVDEGEAPDGAERADSAAPTAADLAAELDGAEGDGDAVDDDAALAGADAEVAAGDEEVDLGD